MHRFAGLFPRMSDGALVVTVQESVYSRDAILKTCYLFTDRCYLYLTRADADSIQVHMAPKSATSDMNAIAGDFCNEMIDQKLRSDIARESGKIREIILAQAFSEGNLLDGLAGLSGDGDDYHPDPLGIGDSSEHKADSEHLP